MRPIGSTPLVVTATVSGPIAVKDAEKVASMTATLLVPIEVAPKVIDGQLSDTPVAPVRPEPWIASVLVASVRILPA